MIKIRSISAILIGLLFISCSSIENKKNINSLFSFKIGYGKNELGLLSGTNSSGDNLINFTYTNGFYYISDRVNNKLLKVTEKGVPVLMIYNKDNYPEIDETVESSPSENTNTPQTETAENSTDQNKSELVYLKLFKSYPIFSPGLITSDGEKNIYIVNRNPENKKVSGSAVDEIMIIKFDNKGNFIYQLGKEGINGNPFGNLSSVICDNSNNLILIENGDECFNIYRFDKTGKLVKLEEINQKSIPILKSESNYIYEIVDVSPGYNTNELYVTCQFISRKREVMSIETFATEYEKVYLYSTNGLTGKEKLCIKVLPEYEDLTRLKLDTKERKSVDDLYGNKKKILKPLEKITGADTGGIINMVQKDLPIVRINENKYTIRRYSQNGRIIDKFKISYPENILNSSPMYLTPIGKLVCYLVKEGVIEFIIINP